MIMMDAMTISDSSSAFRYWWRVVCSFSMSRGLKPALTGGRVVTFI
jgi:hypothetical protein